MSVSVDHISFGIVAFCGGAESCYYQYEGNIIADMKVLGLTCFCESGKCIVLIKSHVSTCKQSIVSDINILLCNDRYKIISPTKKKVRISLLTLLNNM